MIIKNFYCVIVNIDINARVYYTFPLRLKNKNNFLNKTTTVDIVIDYA